MSVGYCVIFWSLTMAEFTPEEAVKLTEMFETLGTKPKLDSPEDFKAWMAEYSASLGKQLPKEEQPNQMGDAESTQKTVMTGIPTTPTHWHIFRR